MCYVWIKARYQSSWCYQTWCMRRWTYAAYMYGWVLQLNTVSFSIKLSEPKADRAPSPQRRRGIWLGTTSIRSISWHRYHVLTMSLLHHVYNSDYLCPAPGFVSRLHGVYTVNMFCILAVLHVAMTTLYFGEPITCWAPAHFKADHSIYLEKVG